jgi:hypothetical protein
MEGDQKMRYFKVYVDRTLYQTSFVLVIESNPDRAEELVDKELYNGALEIPWKEPMIVDDEVNLAGSVDEITEQEFNDLSKTRVIVK